MHKDVEDAKTESDQKFVLAILNTRLRAILKRFGINLAGGFIWYQSPDKDWNQLQTKWNVLSSISDRIPVEDDYLYEEFDIPKPDNYEAMKEELEMKHAFKAFEQPLQNPLKDDDVQTQNLASRKNRARQANNLFNRIRDFFV